MSRDYTNKITEMAEEGAVSWETIAREALERMSEDEVESMCVECDWITPDDFDDDEDDDVFDSLDDEDCGDDDEDVQPEDGFDEPDDEESMSDRIGW